MVSARGRRIARITSQEARIAVPPFSGAKLKMDVSVFCVIEDFAAIDSFNKLHAGSGDFGLVQATTTRMSTM